MTDCCLYEQVARPDILSNLQRLLVSQQAQPALITPNTFTLCLHILVVLASNSPTISLALLRQDLGRTLHQLLVADKTLQPSTSTSSKMANTSSSNQDHEHIELVPHSGQELYEMTCLVGELLPPLPGDGVFAVDGLLGPVRDPMVWQWQDDRGAWHTYGYPECRAVEAAYLAGESEVLLTTNAATFSLNLVSRHEIREDTGTARSANYRYS
jgi:E3 ubiquitin-protein ligase TRIP12